MSLDPQLLHNMRVNFGLGWASPLSPGRRRHLLPVFGFVPARGPYEPQFIQYVHPLLGERRRQILLPLLVELTLTVHPPSQFRSGGFAAHVDPYVSVLGLELSQLLNPLFKLQLRTPIKWRPLPLRVLDLLGLPRLGLVPWLADRPQEASLLEHGYAFGGQAGGLPLLEELVVLPLLPHPAPQTGDLPRDVRIAVILRCVFFELLHPIHERSVRPHLRHFACGLAILPSRGSGIPDHAEGLHFGALLLVHRRVLPPLPHAVTLTLPLDPLA
mmetsp:Transcript_57310/g.170902  ORF Transcript_57310/g.170902 Transcript_57310/m.170902 type:complete len:271 (-) Transcript_57310:1690-2502(-)